MKKLLFILFLLPLIGFGQGFNLSSSSQAFVNLTTVTISSAAYTAGHTYVFFITTTVASGTVEEDPSISSGGLVLVKRGTISVGTRRTNLYTLKPATSQTTAIVFTYSVNQLLQLFSVWKDDGTLGLYTNISVASDNNTSANPSLTMANTISSHTIATFINNANPFGGTVESGWTEDFDAGLGGPVGHYGYHRNSTTDNTVTVTAASSTWTGIAIQFTLNARRIFIQ